MGSNFISTAELSRAFRKSLSGCLITGSFASYRNALLFGPATYWGEDMSMSTDYILELAASEAAFALANLPSAGEKDPAGLTLGLQDPDTTTNTSKQVPLLPLWQRSI